MCLVCLLICLFDCLYVFCFFVCVYVCVCVYCVFNTHIYLIIRIPRLITEYVEVNRGHESFENGLE